MGSSISVSSKKVKAVKPAQRTAFRVPELYELGVQREYATTKYHQLLMQQHKMDKEMAQLGAACR